MAWWHYLLGGAAAGAAYKNRRGLKDLLMGKKGGEDQLKRYLQISGTQKKFLKPIQKALKHLNIRGRSQLRKLLEYEAPEFKARKMPKMNYNAVEKPALRQWEEQVVPSILERFTGMNARSSSGLQQTLGQAAGSLAERLAGNRAQLNQQRHYYNLQNRQFNANLNAQLQQNNPTVRQNALQQLMAQNQLGMTQTHGRYVQQGAAPQQGLLAQIAPMAGMAIGGAIGGPAGAAAGGAMGGAIPGLNYNAMGG